VQCISITSAQYLTLQKYFSHPSLQKKCFSQQSKFSYFLFFSTLAIKLHNWDCKIGGKLVTANHLDQSLWSTNQKYGAASEYHIYYILLWQALGFAVLPICQPQLHSGQNCWPKISLDEYFIFCYTSMFKKKLCILINKYV